MRLRRRSTFMLVYVKAKELKFPIAVPLPIVVIEELLQAVVVICLLCTPSIKTTIDATVSPPWKLDTS
jgi:hypothetical protein